MTDELAAQTERNALIGMVLATAIARDSQAEHDARCGEAADALRRIIQTFDQIDDATMLKIAAVNSTSDNNMLWQLIALRLEQVGALLPLYQDAAAFFAPISEQVDAILASAHQHMH